MTGRGGWSRWIGAVLALTLLTAGCAEAADAGDPAIESALEAVEQRTTEDEALDVVFEQGLEMGADGFADAFNASERACVEADPDLVGLDVRRILTDPDAGAERVALMSVLIGCMEDPATNEGLIRQIEGSLALAAPQLDIVTAEASCMLGRVLEDSDDPAYTLVMGDRPADVGLFLAAAEECFSAENFAAFSGEAGAGPQAYGDDARFDAMYDDCVDGDVRACDLLYLQASEGSEYDEVASTCAGASPAGDVFCWPQTEVDDTGAAPADSPALPLLAADCEAGDLTACDLLFRLAPVGSEYEQIGDTCAGRVAVGALPDCRTRLG